MTMLPRESQFEARGMLWLEITNFCNLTCAHCYNVSGPGRPIEPAVSVDRYRELLREARDMGFGRVQFIGGEPLFYPHLRELVDCALSLDFSEIEIFSNLTHLPGWLFLEPYRGIKFATSFYSDDPAVHDSVCGTKGAHHRTLASLKRLIAAAFAIRAGYIDMEANAGHFLRTRDYLANIGVTEVGYDAIRKFGRANSNGEASMDGLCGQCAGGNLSVDADGNVSGCIMSKRWAFGSVRDSNLSTLFESGERRKFVRDLKDNLKQREPMTPMLCDPAYQGQCAPNCQPSCYPSQNCNPCSPFGAVPCNPNGRCGPF